MSLSKKSSRTIVVQGFAYRWAVSGDSGYLWLLVERDDVSGQRLEVLFDYSDRVDARADGSATLHQRRSITPGVVETMIIAALSRGWASTALEHSPMRLSDGDLSAPENGRNV